MRPGQSLSERHPQQLCLLLHPDTHHFTSACVCVWGGGIGRGDDGVRRTIYEQVHASSATPGSSDAAHTSF